MFKLLLVTAFSKVTAYSSQVVPDEDSKEEGAFAMKLVWKYFEVDLT